MTGRDHREKVPARAGARALAARAKGKVAAKDKDRVRDAARGKEKVKVVVRGRAADEISESFREGSITMPGGDRTGPMGMGPMTGRAAGYCTGSAVPGYMNAPVGRGFLGGGGGRGGRGRRNRFYATGLTGWQRAAAGQPAFAGGQPTAVPQAGPDTAADVSKEQELDLLKRRAEGVANTLDEINKRIAALESQPREG